MRSPNRASSTVIICFMRRERTCYAALGRIVKRPRATSSLSASSAMTASDASSNDVSAKSPQALIKNSFGIPLSLVPAGGHRGQPLIHLFLRNVFLVRRHGPNVSKRIRQRPGTVPIELVLQRLQLHATG